MSKGAHYSFFYAFIVLMSCRPGLNFIII